MLKATIGFDGCSCGCTRGYKTNIEAATQDSMDRAQAEWSLDYLVEGTDRFRKIHGMTDAAKGLALKALALENEITTLECQKSTPERAISSLEYEIRSIQGAASLLRVDIPTASQAEIASAQERIEGLLPQVEDS